MSEDAQPNEVRLARKGSTAVPRVHTTHRPSYASYRHPDARLSRAAKRHDTAVVEIHLPRECGSYNARKRWIEDQKRRLQTSQYHSVVSHRYLADKRSVLFTCRLRKEVTDARSNADRTSTTRPLSLMRAHGSLGQSSVLGPSRTPLGPQPKDALSVAPTISLVEEECAARWSTFRSGRLDLFIPFDTGTPSEDDGVHHALPSVQGEDGESPPREFEQARSSCSRAHSDAEPIFLGYTTLARDILPLSLGPHDKPRRLLHDDDFAYLVTAHGVIDRVDVANSLKWDRNVRLPPSPLEESVDDACILFYQGEPVIILGHAREHNQISLLDLKYGQVSRQLAICRDVSKRFGVSALTSLMSPLKFASGGYDHRVHIWDIAQDLASASSVELAIKHTSTVHSLLPILDTSHKIVSVGSDRNVVIYDISSERAVQTLKMSCMPYHAHKTDSVFCTLLEVAHLETQFELRDYRTPDSAVTRFGFITDERRGRYDKAGTWNNFVAGGDKNGTVRLWDFRNVSQQAVIRQRYGDPVVQVANTGFRWMACSKRNELAYIDF